MSKEEEIMANKQWEFNYNIFLIGFMGTGKSTIANYLCRLLDCKQVEMDMLIEQEQKLSIGEIFEKYGEGYFRDLESNLLKSIQQEGSSIVSCGGGVVVRPDNIKTMKQNGKVVLLTAAPETVYERVKNNDNRPILKDRMNIDYISELMAKRKDQYLAAADIVIATDNKSVAEICQELIDQLGVQSEV